MRYVIEIPDEIEEALEKRASDTGNDVARVIELAVAAFLVDGVLASATSRQPDSPLEAIESVAPCDLPRTSPRPIVVEKHSQRMPDPIPDLA